ncbi:hypothetical protein ZMO01_00430 [Zymomonas mobilis subsp. mobilis]|nr:hypothetical protein ZMO01_00430 [Zymomonas mobilis subsp. mobilis]
MGARPIEKGKFCPIDGIATVAKRVAIAKKSKAKKATIARAKRLLLFPDES